jgi:uncharacterized protein YoxC
MVNFRQPLIAIFMAATLVAASAYAQTNLTQILDTITNPDGTPFNGTVVITWNGYSDSGSGTVSRLSTSATVYNGALSVLLVPTTTASPGTYYQVVYSSSDGTVTWTETWQVPPSTTALTIAEVRQTSTQGTGSGTGSGGGGQYATLPISISEVTDLASDLSSIDNSISTIQSTATALGTTVAGLNSTVTTQGTTLSTLNTTVSGLSGSVTSLNSMVASLGTTITGLNTTVTGLSSTVAGLNTTVASDGTSITTLTTNLGSLTTTVAGNTSSLNTVTGTVTGLTTNVTNLTNLVNGLNATVNTLSAAGSTAVFVDDETPAGAINGANTVFSLANTPAPAMSLTLFRNGLELTQGIDYTLSGSAITFSETALPQTGDIVLAYYRMPGTGSATNFTDNETPGGAINGINLTFTLASAPNPAGSLRLFRNGLLMDPSGDYTLSGSSITITSTAPQTGDSLAAYYRH